MSKHTFKTLIKTLCDAGFQEESIRPAILPEWWKDETCADDPKLLREVEIRVGQLLGMKLSEVRQLGRNV